MKILVVAHESEFVGGANRALFALLKYWNENSLLDFEVLFPSENGGCIDVLKEMGITYHVVKYYKVFTELRSEPQDLLRRIKVNGKYYYNERAAKKISHILETRQFDLVYSNTRMTSIGASIAKSLRIPHVIHIREFGNVNTIWGPADIKDIYKKSNKIITISNALKQYLAEKVPADKFVVSHDGVNYVDNNVSFVSDRKTFDLLLTGRITIAKAQDEAIEALKMVLECGRKNVVLHFAGSMNGGTKHEVLYMEKLKNMIKDYGLEENVVFHGEVSDMKELRSKMDVELMCALRETFGWVTVEGMRSGCLLIGTNTGATPEIVKNGETGLIYQQGNAKELADKIIWAMDNTEEVERIRRNGFEFANTHFTIEKNAMEVYEVIKKVLDNSRGR